jgi:hypothetical protein
MNLEKQVKYLSNETQENIKQLADNRASQEVIEQSIEYASLGGDY